VKGLSGMKTENGFMLCLLGLLSSLCLLCIATVNNGHGQRTSSIVFIGFIGFIGFVSSQNGGLPRSIQQSSLSHVNMLYCQALEGSSKNSKKGLKARDLSIN
jgi:hypothetical protein